MQLRISYRSRIFCVGTIYRRYVSCITPTNYGVFETNAFMVQASLTASLLGLSFGQLIIGPFSEYKD